PAKRLRQPQRPPRQHVPGPGRFLTEEGPAAAGDELPAAHHHLLPRHASGRVRANPPRPAPGHADHARRAAEAPRTVRRHGRALSKRQPFSLPLIAHQRRYLSNKEAAQARKLSRDLASSTTSPSPVSARRLCSSRSYSAKLVGIEALAEPTA